MNILRQLFRQPLRTIAAVLVLSLASSFICLSFGVFFSAQKTAASIDEKFVTIAIPSNEKEKVEHVVNDGQTIYIRESVITAEMWEFLNTLPETPAVKGAYQQQFISAWSPSLVPTLSAQEPASYSWWSDQPCTDALFVVELTEIGDVEDMLVWQHITLRGEIVEAVLLNESYAERSMLTIDCSFNTQEEIDAAKLELGGKYLVYGESYQDKDLELRIILAEPGLMPEDVSWDNISYDEAEIKEMADSLRKHGEIEQAAQLAAMYHYPSGGASTMSRADLDAIDSGSILVVDQGSHLPEGYMAHNIDLTDTELTRYELTTTPTIVRLDTDVQSFLDSAEGESWQTAIDNWKIRQQCVPVLGTDFLESMYVFQQKDAIIVDGRSISQDEYEDGAPVCVISESLALSSGLVIGDSIDLSFYWGIDPYFLEIDYNVAAQPYLESIGFTGESNTYEIVGTYRQSNLWEIFPLTFTPNTVFVPNKSITGDTYTTTSGIFYNFVLENGGVDEVKAAIAAQGYPENTLLYYDSGFSEFSDTLDSFQSSASALFAAACLTWLAILVMYLVLFVRSQRKNAGLMLSLGSGKSGARRFVFSFSMLPVLLASIIGAISGAVLLSGALQRILTSAVGIFDSTFSSSSASEQMRSIEDSLVAIPSACVIMAVVSLVLYALAVWIYGRNLSKQAPRALLRDK